MKSTNPSWRENWKREIEGVYLYRKLAGISNKPEMMRALNEMADQEEQHAAVWEKYIKQVEKNPPTPRPDLRIHIVFGFARIFGADAVLGFLLNDEVSDITSYTYQALSSGEENESTYSKVLKDEATHARSIVALQNDKELSRAEPWHRGANASGWVRNMVYGFNDGLTANFGLVMGVIGANITSHLILLTGFAGLLADALSMAGSGFLAARSEQEVRQHHLALERAELKFMPEEERQELIGIFKRKGIPRGEAATIAAHLMENPDVALSQLAREELGIDPESPASPSREGIVTGIATALGAFIPLIPFIFLTKSIAIWVGVGISMAAHFLVGAGRSIFTGRPAIRSGFEMFLVGMGVALLTYFLGLLIGVRL